LDIPCYKVCERKKYGRSSAIRHIKSTMTSARWVTDQ